MADPAPREPLTVFRVALPLFLSLVPADAIAELLIDPRNPEPITLAVYLSQAQVDLSRLVEAGILSPVPDPTPVPDVGDGPARELRIVR